MSFRATRAEFPLVSVVIPNHNYARFLPQAIESVLGQSYSNLEVVVVDNDSTDESQSVLKGYEDRIRWYHQRDQGVAGGRNRGIQESRGDCIAFLDADDVWVSDKLTRQVAALGGSNVGMVSCGVHFIDAAGHHQGTCLPEVTGPTLHDFALLRSRSVIAGGSAALIRRECFDRVGLFDPQLSMSADWDMWRRIASHYRITVLKDPLLLYRRHGSAMSARLDLLERDMLRAFQRMFSDPCAAEVWPLRRRCYANLYYMLAGSYLQAREPTRGLSYLLRSVIAWPATLSEIYRFPVRQLRRYVASVRQARGTTV